VRFVLAAAAVALALALPLGLGTAEVAHAERGVYFDDDGYRCEYNAVEDLVKIVCRDPRDFGDYYICFGEIRPDVVFIDCFGDARVVESTEVPTREFLRRLGR
jgi:hypothetical protein